MLTITAIDILPSDGPGSRPGFLVEATLYLTTDVHIPFLTLAEHISGAVWTHFPTRYNGGEPSPRSTFSGVSAVGAGEYEFRVLMPHALTPALELLRGWDVTDLETQIRALCAVPSRIA